MNPNLSSLLNLDFIQLDPKDSEVTFNPRTFRPILQVSRNLPVPQSQVDPLNVSRIPQPTLVSSSLRDSPSPASNIENWFPELASTPKEPTAPELLDEKEQRVANAATQQTEQTNHEDTLNKLTSFSFSPVRRLAENSFQRLRPYFSRSPVTQSKDSQFGNGDKKTQLKDTPETIFSAKNLMIIYL